ncbi:MAG TPA: FkbM family methyltransferase [Roseiflexaceae bacterium]|nr:FkbM family methyltransferase [Roseiflexaceae bacterium]
MLRYQARFERHVLRLLCGLSGPRAGAAGPEQYRTRIWGGPLRGCAFAMPQLERISFALGTYERHIVRELHRVLRPGDVAYDIGANAGYLSLVMARRVGTAGRVVAFEADPRNAAALAANIALNGQRNITLVPKAVSDTSGSVSFASFGYSLVGHIATPTTPADAQLLTVPAVALDDLFSEGLLPAPRCIKIDVEGAEDRVIAGAARLLAHARPVIIAEVRPDALQHHILPLLEGLGYRARELVGGWRLGRDRVGEMLFEPG